MNNNFPDCLAFTLSPAQDGQPLHVTPGDEGGATAYGITLATLTGYLGKPCTPHDLAAMTQGTIQAIYATGYWTPPRCDDLPLGVDLMVFDFGVTTGPRTSARMLQKALGLSGAEIDGWVGPQTMALTKARPASALIVSLSVMQDVYYGSLAGAAEFDAGWRARTSRRAALAQSWLKVPPVPAAPIPPLSAAIDAIAADPDNSADNLNATELAKDTS
jgi:lysozyme family protein